MLWQWFKFKRKILVEFCSNSSKDLTLQVAEKKGQITCQERSSLHFLGKLKRTQLIYHALSLRSNLHKPLIIPTSPQICWCCQVGKIIQADNINDWTHHSSIVLREREKGGKKTESGFLECPAKLPEIRKHKVARKSLVSPLWFW